MTRRVQDRQLAGAVGPRYRVGVVRFARCACRCSVTSTSCTGAGTTFAMRGRPSASGTSRCVICIRASVDDHRLMRMSGPDQGRNCPADTHASDRPCAAVKAHCRQGTVSQQGMPRAAAFQPTGARGRTRRWGRCGRRKIGHAYDRRGPSPLGEAAPRPDRGPRRHGSVVRAKDARPISPDRHRGRAHSSTSTAKKGRGGWLRGQDLNL